MISRGFYISFLYYLVIEGALRKWVFPSLSNELFLVKDLLLAMSGMALFAFERRQLSKVGPLSFKPIEGTMWQLWCVIVMVGAAVSGFSLTGAIGLRYYLVPLLLLLVHPVLAADLEQFEGFVGHYLALCFMVCILGFVQFASSPDAAINRYSWSPSSEMDVATFGEAVDRAADSHVRITGTFSYISPFASYLQFACFSAIGIFLTARAERSRLVHAVLIVTIVASLFMTGSRAPTLTTIAASFLFTPLLRRALGGRFAFLGVFLGAVAIGLGFWLVRDVASLLIARNEAAGDTVNRISATLFFPFHTIALSDFWGEGLGATFLGLGQLTGSGVFEYRFDEVFQDRLAVEVGILGYLFFVVFKIYFLVATWRLARRTQSFRIKVWLTVSLAYQVSLLWAVPVYNSVAMIFYVFSIAQFAWLRGLAQASGKAVVTRPRAAGRSMLRPQP